MKTLTIDKNKCESYKSFYEIVYDFFDGKHMIDWEECDNMLYSADMLSEFLWYASYDGETEFVMLNFDIDRLKNNKTYDDYKWQLIFKVLDRFVNQYPSNKLTIATDK